MDELIISPLTSFFNELFGSKILPPELKWLAVGGILLFIELAHRAWLIVWFALGALGAAVAAFFFPNDAYLQIAVFFGVSVVSLGVFVWIHADKPPPAAPLVGEVGRCIEPTSLNGHGVVAVGGVEWKARPAPGEKSIEQNSRVEVVDFDADELVILVKHVERDMGRERG